MKRLNQQAGFTLIEMLIVLLIISILMIQFRNE
ncbi:Competence protein ComGC [Lysinibacillus capsici]|uniref:Competence protein ComGC n=1 Tax=Lysinibacillus capsici TaxID=2115968 RepID=A0A2X0ZZ43_9BACI|nr:prepilin-type N-terminal cleavage/methylation domain-containing protein [Lysinibacillus capsici]SPU38188.1 Competence protein ComGC [Lysinibacillus capsici]